jgi:hypothetical protein
MYRHMLPQAVAAEAHSQTKQTLKLQVQIHPATDFFFKLMTVPVHYQTGLGSKFFRTFCALKEDVVDGPLVYCQAGLSAKARVADLTVENPVYISFSLGVNF